LKGILDSFQSFKFTVAIHRASEQNLDLPPLTLLLRDRPEHWSAQVFWRGDGDQALTEVLRYSGGGMLPITHLKAIYTELCYQCDVIRVGCVVIGDVVKVQSSSARLSYSIYAITRLRNLWVRANKIILQTTNQNTR